MHCSIKFKKLNKVANFSVSRNVPFTRSPTLDGDYSGTAWIPVRKLKGHCPFNAVEESNVVEQEKIVAKNENRL